MPLEAQDVALGMRLKPMVASITLASTILGQCGLGGHVAFVAARHL
jgi:hypothetical protein